MGEKLQVVQGSGKGGRTSPGEAGENRFQRVSRKEEAREGAGSAKSTTLARVGGQAHVGLIISTSEAKTPLSERGYEGEAEPTCLTRELELLLCQITVRNNWNFPI